MPEVAAVYSTLHWRSEGHQQVVDQTRSIESAVSSVEKASQNVTSSLASIEDDATRATVAIGKAFNSASETAQRMGRDVSTALRELQQGLGFFEQLDTRLNAIGASAETLTSDIDTLTKSIAEQRAAVEAANNARKESIAQRIREGGHTAEQAAELRELTKAVTGGRDSIRDMERQLESMLSIQRQINESGIDPGQLTARLNEATSQLASFLGQLEQAGVGAEQSAIGFVDASELIATAQSVAQQAIKSTDTELRTIGSSLDKATNQLKIFQVEAQNATQALMEAGGIDALNERLDFLTGRIQVVGQEIERLQSLGNPLQALEDQGFNIDLILKAPAAMEAAANAIGVTEDELRNMIETAKEGKDPVEELRKTLEELGAEQAKLRGIKESLSIGDEADEARLKVEDLVGDAKDRFEEVEGAMGGVKKESGRMNGALRLNQTTMSGLVTSLRTGRASSSLFAGALRSVAAAASTMSVGVIAAGVALGALVAIPLFAVGKIAINIASIGREAALVPPEINAISDSIGALAGVTQSQLNRALDESITKFRSLGAAAPDQASAKIAELANVGQFLSPQAFDFDQVFAAFRRAAESVDAGPLEIIGLNVAKVNRELQSLAEQGVPASERAVVLLNTAYEHLAANKEEIIAQAAREENSIQGAANAFKRMVDAAANSDAVRETLERIGTALRDLVPHLQPLIEGAVRGFVAVGNAVAFVIEKLESMFGWLVRVNDIIAGWELPKLDVDLGEIADSPAAFGGLLAVLDGTETKVNDVGDAVEDAAKEFDAMEHFENLLEGIGEAFAGVGDDADEAASAVRDFSNTTGTMRGLEGQLRSVGQAFADMNDVLDPGEVTDFVGNLAGAIDFIAQRGAANVRASLEAEAELLKQFFDQGFLSAEQLQQGLDELESKRAFADPLIRKVEEMERGLANTQSAGEQAAAGIDTTTVAASTATGQVETLIGTLGSIPSDVGTNIHIGVTGPGAAILMGGMSGRSWTSGGVAVTDPVTGEVARMRRGGAGGGGGGSGSSAGEAEITSATPAPGGTHAADRGLIRRAQEEQARRNPENIWDFNRDRNITARDRGGGGGGGGSQGASIEEIREFFRQVNAVIMSGIRGGKIFSTAGNAIPVGAPGEFLNTKGGALIQTVNIRGVWDFADPAAKRQIIKELEESLASLKREVA